MRLCGCVINTIGLKEDLATGNQLVHLLTF